MHQGIYTTLHPLYTTLHPKATLFTNSFVRVHQMYQMDGKRKKV
jgi:hypothetical protein